MSELLDYVHSAIMCLEGTNKGSIKGSASGIRKAKSLVGRWLEKHQNIDGNTESNEIAGGKVIERDTVVLAKVTTGRDAASVKVIK